MNHSIVIDRQVGLILVSAHGVASMEGIQSYIADLMKPPCSEVKFNMLTDFRDVDMRGLSADDVRNVAWLVRQRLDEVLAVKHAVVVSQPLSFGFARMYQSLNDQVDPQDFKIFYDIDEAREWVCSGERGKGAPIAEKET